MSRENLPARAQMNLPADVAATIEADVAAIQERVAAPAGSRITIQSQGKAFRLPDGQEVKDAIDLIIVDFVAAQLWYEQKYDRNRVDSSPPMCFAIGLDERHLVPSGNSIMPQSETSCAECWAYKWGSDRDGGRGKDCGTVRLLACLLPDATDPTAIYTLKASSTATKYFDSYVSMLAKAHTLPPYMFTTTVRFDPTSDFASLRFTNPVPGSPEQIAVALQAREAARRILLTEPDMVQARQAMEAQSKERTTLKAPRRAQPVAGRR